MNDPPNFNFSVQALLAARNSAAVVFVGTFGALAYVISFINGDLDVLCIVNSLSLSLSLANDFYLNLCFHPS